MKNEEGEGVGISFVIMPVEILQDKGLTPSEKILYAYLSIFRKGVCFQSNAKLEEITGIPERTISSGLSKLESMKYVFIEFVNNNTSKRRIYVVLDNPKKLAYLSSKGMFKDMFSLDKKVETAKVSEKEEEPEPEKVEFDAPAKNSPEPVEEAEDELEPKNMADDLKSRGIVKRSDYATHEDYVKALYKRNTVTL